eukprot:CAMPEP_0113485354 /NCGR_PEP_ID=MMETSP0014_2-20120614/24440_1 /TAXON_ID=2857 /ORGANISM="Nitzschia sp." /LENGTH=366 /DNA_ID=CAMNT_0000378997 /DNA_START=237 /DNA_END=1337 /DNA_ORIENTATION=+ /assembly_acc=CAM_ASM_000159
MDPTLLSVVGYEADIVDFISPLPHPSDSMILHDDPTTLPDDDGNLLQMRMLKVGKNMTTGAMIGWYCFASVVVGAVFVCLLYVYCHNSHAHRRAQRALDDQQRLESIEANVARWSKVENERNKRVVRACLQRNTKPFVRKGPASIKRHEHEEENNNSNICGICLDDLVHGQPCVSSSNHRSCRHVFHDGCIVEWFMNRRDWLCPTCRQPFVRHHDLSRAGISIGIGVETSRSETITLGPLSVACDHDIGDDVDDEDDNDDDDEDDTIDQSQIDDGSEESKESDAVTSHATPHGSSTPPASTSPVDITTSVTSPTSSPQTDSSTADNVDVFPQKFHFPSKNESWDVEMGEEDADKAEAEGDDSEEVG